jgi:hypothetical protein
VQPVAPPAIPPISATVSLKTVEVGADWADRGSHEAAAFSLRKKTLSLF